MRVEPAFLAGVVASVLLFPGKPVTGQDSDGGGKSKTASPSMGVHVAKLMAQEAALPSLRGEDKFTLRESWWNGQISPGKAKLIQVQLFARNAYQFWMAVPNRSAELNLNLYDSEGNLVPTTAVAQERGNLVSIIAEPEASGVYYIRISLQTSIQQDQQWAVIYAYR